MASEDSDDGHPSGWKENPKIVIIGAGISGLTAGRYLFSHGFSNIDILEATDRIGGRIWSIDLETVNGQKAELGANWIHGIDLNPIFKLSVDNGLIKPTFQGRKLGQKLMFVNFEGEPVNAKVVEEVDLIYGLLMSQVDDFFQEHMPTPVENDSVGAFLQREFEEKLSHYHGPDKDLRRMIFQQRMLNESIINGCNSMTDMSLSEAGCFEELPGIHYTIPQGFDEVAAVISKDIPKDRIQMSHPVTQITWSEEAVNATNKDKHHDVCVECANGKRFYADHVLVTISLGCLQQYASRLFDPPLPDFKMDAINRMAIGCVNKIVLEFASGPVLPKGIRRMELITNRDETQDTDFVYSSEYLRDYWHKKISFFEAIEPNVLIGWLCGREAEYMEELSDTQVIQRCTQVLESALKKNIPSIKRVIKSNWKTMPYCMGAYSFIPVGATTDDVEALSEPVCSSADKPVLMFAGEATHPTFYSSSHGAYLTGEREAQRILNLYQH